jgi:hypothetical protein
MHLKTRGRLLDFHRNLEVVLAAVFPRVYRAPGVRFALLRLL